MFSAQPAVIVQKAALANNFGSLANALALSAAFKAQLPLAEEHLDIYIIEFKPLVFGVCKFDLF